MKAGEVKKRRLVTEKGNLVVISIWKIPRSPYYPEGLKYSFQFIHDNKRILGYDNYKKEGHHRHFYHKKEKIDFKDLNEIKERFVKEVKRLENEN